MYVCMFYYIFGAVPVYRVLLALDLVIEQILKMCFFSQYLLNLLSLDGRNGSYFCGKMRVHFAFQKDTKKLPTDNVYGLSLF